MVLAVRRGMLRFLFLLLSAAPALAGRLPDSTGLCWPPGPERRRICFERAIAAPADLGSEGGGLLSGVVEFLFGGRSTESWFVQPVGIAVSPGGRIYVTDPGARGVHLITLDGDEGEHRLVTGTDAGPFLSPVGVAVAADGSVIVSDAEDRSVLVLDEDLDLRSVIRGDLGRPTGIAVAGDTIYVVDAGRHRIHLFNRGGSLLGGFGTRGGGEGEMNFPINLVRHGDLFVVDALNYRIVRLSPEGAFRTAFGTQGGVAGSFASPKAIAADADGHLYVTDALLDNVQIFTPEGALLLVVGRQGEAPGEFMSPAGIAIDSDNRIYVVETLNRRLQIFRYLP